MARKYHRKDVLKALVNYVKNEDKFPTVEDLKRAPRDKYPSYSTVLKHFGSLEIAKKSVRIELGTRKELSSI